MFSAAVPAPGCADPEVQSALQQVEEAERTWDRLEAELGDSYRWRLLETWIDESTTTMDMDVQGGQLVRVTTVHRPGLDGGEHDTRVDEGEALDGMRGTIRDWHDACRGLLAEAARSDSIGVELGDDGLVSRCDVSSPDAVNDLDTTMTGVDFVSE